MRHRLFTVHVLARGHGIYDDLTVMVVGHRHDDAVDVRAVEQVLVAAGGRKARVSGNLFGARMSAVIQICRRNKLGSGCQRGGKQTRPLHADANNSKPDGVTRLNPEHGGGGWPWTEEHRLGREDSSCSRDTRLQEVAAGKLVSHGTNLDLG
jgi:hypothetical protein